MCLVGNAHASGTVSRRDHAPGRAPRPSTDARSGNSLREGAHVPFLVHTTCPACCTTHATGFHVYRQVFSLPWTAEADRRQSTSTLGGTSKACMAIHAVFTRAAVWMTARSSASGIRCRGARVLIRTRRRWACLPRACHCALAQDGWGSSGDARTQTGAFGRRLQLILYLQIASTRACFLFRAAAAVSSLRTTPSSDAQHTRNEGSG